MAEQKFVTFVIERQDGPNESSYTQEFDVPYRPSLNVVAALMEIQKNPVTRDGKRVAPVAWECNCLEKVCGACMMVINGKAKQACCALVDELEQPIHLAPARTFPVIRDLLIDRTVMFENLKKIQGWINVDGSWKVHEAPRQNPYTAQTCYEISHCMTCGCCLEACPNVGPQSDFMGPAPLAQALLFNLNPLGKYDEPKRLEAIMQKGGITSCGNSQNCEAVCPKDIKLTRYIAQLNRDVNIQALKNIFNN
ncbi:MAG: succinate dehydrogenase iron-sulfur subunit [Schwartzia sp.]|nr:succinate dehydrogenase iron-sulfur subunit [Schwartzia sp. (in: firmicutes)]